MQFIPSRSVALQQLNQFVPNAGRKYANTRNHDDGPPRQNVSQLSPWLHAGSLSEAEVIAATLHHHSASTAEKFISEVFWRIYFKGYLEQRPSIWRSYCEGRDAAFAKMESNPGLSTAYNEAIEGRTGIAAFDYWAHELVDQGYLHNHARMWFASVWIFTLKLDWHLGADFFLRHLLDGDAASNTLSWRWVGGLHTKGKTYLARADNIARYTENHPEGPLEAEGLRSDAPALEESNEHTRQNLDLPRTLASDALQAPFALILHDEAASHVPLELNTAPAIVIGAARPEARSPNATAREAATFARGAVRTGMEDAASAYGCPAREWGADDSLNSILAEAGINQVALPYLPVGWTRDAFMPSLSPLIESNRAIILLSDVNRETWPLAKAGFFGVKKKIDDIVRNLGLQQPAIASE